MDTVCRRVITAIQSSNLRITYVRKPGEAEKEEAKKWIEEQVFLTKWQNFWMVNSTLVPLYRKSSHYKEIFFNQKSHYSINVQIIKTPNCKNIDYTFGFWCSRHNTYSFTSTKLRINFSQYLEKDEWCCGDAGYHLQKCLMIHYKSLATSLKPNRTFNFHLSQICIRLEYTIGYLKGCFQCLKEHSFQCLNA